MAPADRTLAEDELDRLETSLASETDPERRVRLRVETVRRLVRQLGSGRAAPPIAELSVVRGVVLASREARADAEAARRAALDRGERHVPTAADLEAAAAAPIGGP